jgi:hypothetical protein
MVKLNQLKAKAELRGVPVSNVNKWGLSGRLVRTPHWLPILLSAALVAAPWLRWRFSLRTLLIATTLVAVVLGAIVYATRQ